MIKVIVTLCALYFAFHAGNGIVQHCAAVNFSITMRIMQGALITLSLLGMIAAAIMIWREL